MSDAMKELIEKLEKATGPSYELDHEIGSATRLFRDWHRPYTSSIDAALTLVPEGLSADVKCYAEGVGGAEIWRVSPELFAVTAEQQEDLRRRNGSFIHVNVGGKTPALALCIAALKARAALACSC